MQAALALDDPTWNQQRHRLAICMGISAFAAFLVLSTFDWPPRFDFPLLIPLELEVTLRDAPEMPAAEVRELPRAEPRELPPPEARPLPSPATPATPTVPAERAAVTERPAVSAAEVDVAEGVDWYVELERVAAEVNAEAAAEPQSMHPEFDELRRIAAQRYSKPLTNKPSSVRDVSYMLPEEPGLVNRHAFGSFEEDMILFTIPFGRRSPKNLPWVETIRARYDYLDKEPDELPVLKAAQGDEAGR